MWRLNSTVTALSPLGNRRGGDDVAAMASSLKGADIVLTLIIRFRAAVEFASIQISELLQ
jgi:hypothetical protein